MKLKYLIMSALFCALIFVTTSFIKIPLAVTGYVHLGDAFVFLACVFLPMPYAVAAAGAGSALADLLGGYVLYAPVTLLAKSAMALIFCLFAKRNKAAFDVIGVTLATVCMAFAYFVYEWILYGFAVSVANVPFNLLQGGVSAVAALFCAYSLKRYRYVKRDGAKAEAKTGKASARGKHNADKA